MKEQEWHGWQGRNGDEVNGLKQQGRAGMAGRVAMA